MRVIETGLRQVYPLIEHKYSQALSAKISHARVLRTFPSAYRRNGWKLRNSMPTTMNMPSVMPTRCCVRHGDVVRNAVLPTQAFH